MTRPEITTEDLQIFIKLLQVQLRRFGRRGRYYAHPSRANYADIVCHYEKERDKVQALIEKIEVIRQNMLTERLKEVVRPRRAAPWRRDVIGRILDPD